MNEVHEIEITLDHCKEQIGRANLVAELHNNGAFNKIIIEGFFGEYPAQLVRSLADPQIANNEKKREEVLRTLEGISVLHGFLRNIYNSGEVALRSLQDYEDELAEARKNAQ